jgi:hypothetical protein
MNLSIDKRSYLQKPHYLHKKNTLLKDDKVTKEIIFLSQYFKVDDNILYYI